MAQIKTKLAYGVSGTLPTANIADDAITSAKIADNAVVTAAINADAITSAKIADNAVVTAAINADAVTDAKIADDVVGTEHLTAGEVDATALGANSVTTAKINNDAVTVDKLNLISTGSVPSLEAKGTSGVIDGYIQLNCSENSHGIKLKSPPHSAGASYTLTFPNNDGDANQFLQTNGSGVLSFADAGGSALEHIASTSVTTTVSSTGFTGCFTSTYENYYFVFHNILNGIDDQPVHLRFKDTSGNILSASEYDWVHTGGNTSGTQVNNSSQNDSSIHLLKNKDHAGVGGNTNAAKGYCHGIIFSPQKTSYASNDNQHCYMTWTFAFPRSTYLHTGVGSAVFTNGTALGGIQIFGGGGGGPTYTDRFEGSIYGIKRS